MLFVAYSATEESSIIVSGTSLDQFCKLIWYIANYEYYLPAWGNIFMASKNLIQKSNQNKFNNFKETLYLFMVMVRLIHCVTWFSEKLEVITQDFA